MSTPFTSGRPPATEDGSQYGYIPHEYVAIIFLIFFGVGTIIHLAQATHRRMWWLLPTACLCGIGEIIGWSARLWAHFKPDSHEAFMMQVISLVISPTPLLAVNFVLLGWIIEELGPGYARLAPRAYTPIFVASDVISLLIQAAGGSIASSATTFARVQLGAHLLLAGIGFQLAALTIYCCLAAEFVVRYKLDRPFKFKAAESESKHTPSPGFLNARTRNMLCALAFSSLVLFIRSVYRVVQLASGWDGRIMRTERYFNVLDGGMIVLALWTFIFVHPGSLRGLQSRAGQRSGEC